MTSSFEALTSDGQLYTDGKKKMPRKAIEEIGTWYTVMKETLNDAWNTLHP